MRSVLSIILISIVTLSAQVDSLSLKNSGYPYKRTERENSTKGQAVFWSILVPGGGHFYLGNRNTGLAYGLVRLLIIPGSVLMAQNLYDGDEAELNIGISLSLIGIASWTADIIHAGYSAKHQGSEKILGYRIDTDLENKRYGIGLTYTFK